MLGLGALVIAALPTSHPILLWNATPSVPIGLYRLVVRAPTKGELAVVRLPAPARRLAVARGYLGTRMLLIKPVAAGPGDVVCRHGMTVTINGGFTASALTVDTAGRVMPRWSDCRILAAGQVFVLSTAPDSFDSRYLGPIDRTHVLGTGQPVWTGAWRSTPDYAARKPLVTMTTTSIAASAVRWPRPPAPGHPQAAP